MPAQVILAAADAPFSGDASVDVKRLLRDDVIDVINSTANPGTLLAVGGVPTSLCRIIDVSTGALGDIRALLLPAKVHPLDSTQTVGRRQSRIDAGFGLPSGKRTELYSSARRTSITFDELAAAVIPDTLDRSRADVHSAGGSVSWIA